MTNKPSILYVMNEENLLYKLINNKYHFCYYSFDGPNDLETYSFQYNQGEVGEHPDFEVEIDKDMGKIMGYKDEAVKTYTIRTIPSTEIQVSIYLKRFLKELGYDKFKPLINHITRTIDFVSKTSGLGINNFVVPSDTLTFETGVYQTVVMVNNKESFRILFIDHIILCGILIDEVTII